MRARGSSFYFFFFCTLHVLRFCLIFLCSCAAVRRWSAVFACVCAYAHKLAGDVFPPPQPAGSYADPRWLKCRSEKEAAPKTTQPCPLLKLRPLISHHLSAPLMQPSLSFSLHGFSPSDHGLALSCFPKTSTPLAASLSLQTHSHHASSSSLSYRPLDHNWVAVCAHAQMRFRSCRTLCMHKNVHHVCVFCILMR